MSFRSGAGGLASVIVSRVIVSIWAMSALPLSLLPFAFAFSLLLDAGMVVRGRIGNQAIGDLLFDFGLFTREYVSEIDIRAASAR